jgi:CxxC motif-containing protein (DUF1111 family)
MTIQSLAKRTAAGPAKVLVATTLASCGLAMLSFGSAGDSNTAPSQTAVASAQAQNAPGADEAPTGFDNRTNGLEDQAAFDKDRGTFEEVESIKDGLGPVYNATSCVSCHQNPVTGGSSQLSEIRAGRHTFDPNDPNPRKVRFEEPPGGSVIQQRAIDPAIQDHVLPEYDVRALRMSNTILGNGFVEVIPDEDLLKIRDAQRRWNMEGFAVVVPVPVAAKPGSDGKTTEFTFVERIGRFGWKCQEASLLSFSAGAYVTEMGITNPLQPNESKPNGRDVSKFDTVPDPEDKITDDDDTSKTVHLFGSDVESFTRFMRSTKASSRDPELVTNLDVIEGEKLFRNNNILGCAVCHQPDFTTPPAGTAITTLDGNRGSDLATVPAALGGKVIHPFSDFLLHDVGTGDGIAQTQHANLPSPGQENLAKIPDKMRVDRGIGRVSVDSDRENQRILKPTEGVDQRTANKVRTAPLWGLRTRPQLMHDGLSDTIEDAIDRHKGQAEGVRLKYQALSGDQKKQLLAFLKSL